MQHRHHSLHILAAAQQNVGTQLLEYFFDKFHSLPFFKVYTVGGLFGKATDDFSDTGKLVEKTTFGKKLS